MPNVFVRLMECLRRVLYPFHRVRSVIDNVSFMGLSDTGKELLLALTILGELPLNYTVIPRIVASTLRTKTRSRASFYEQVRILGEKGLISVDYSENIIKPTMKGLMVAGKYVVLVRMIYTVPMTITLLLLLTILRPWTPWWFLYVATAVAILHHVCNLIVLLMRPVEDRGLSSKLNNLIRVLPETLPIILFLTNTWRKLVDPVEASVEVLDLKTMRVKRMMVKILMVLAG